ncbi:hypothetical protein ESOG_04171 [Escherichia coli E101]|nr:hypothetical protein ESOG_04171 [Escherichia coli E101]
MHSGADWLNNIYEGPGMSAALVGITTGTKSPAVDAGRREGGVNDCRFFLYMPYCARYRLKTGTGQCITVYYVANRWVSVNGAPY